MSDCLCSRWIHEVDIAVSQGLACWRCTALNKIIHAIFSLRTVLLLTVVIDREIEHWVRGQLLRAVPVVFLYVYILSFSSLWLWLCSNCLFEIQHGCTVAQLQEYICKDFNSSNTNKFNLGFVSARTQCYYRKMSSFPSLKMTSCSVFWENQNKPLLT